MKSTKFIALIALMAMFVSCGEKKSEKKPFTEKRWISSKMNSSVAIVQLLKNPLSNDVNVLKCD